MGPSDGGGDEHGVVYVTIINNGPTSDALVSAVSIASRAAQVHENKVDADGMMEMLPLDRIDIPVRARIELKPGAHHVMLVDLKKPLIYKSTFPPFTGRNACLHPPVTL